MQNDEKIDQNANELMLTPQDLAAARKSKMLAAGLAGIANNNANAQGWGNFYLGRMNPHIDAGAPMRAMGENAEQAIKDKQTLLAQAQKKPEIEYAQQMQNPNSSYSKLTKSVAASAVARLQGHPAFKEDPNAQQSFQDLQDQIANSNGSQIHMIMDKNPLVKEMFTSGDAGARLAAMQEMSARRLEQGDKRIGMQQDTQSANAAGVFDKDPNLQALTKQRQAIQRGQHTLNTVDVLTPQLFNEIQMDVANAISGGKAAAVTTQGKVEFESMDQKMAELKQRLTSRPQDINNPEIKAYMNNVLSRLDGAYANNMQERAHQISVGREYKNNPAAQQAIASKMETFRPQEQPAAQPAGQPHPQDDAAVTWAKQNPNDPRAIKILQLNGSK